MIRRVSNAGLRPIKRHRIKYAKLVERTMTSPSASRKKLDKTGTRINVETECLVNFQGRGGRGGFGGGRGRGLGASGNNGGRGGGGSNFGGARHESAPQQDSDKRQECFKCVALGHKGKYAEHSVDVCPHKALFDSSMQDPKLAPRMMQRLSERSAGSDNSRRAVAMMAVPTNSVLVVNIKAISQTTGTHLSRHSRYNHQSVSIVIRSSLLENIVILQISRLYSRGNSVSRVLVQQDRFLNNHLPVPYRDKRRHIFRRSILILK
jgi:hypothetical protein